MAVEALKDAVSVGSIFTEEVPAATTARTPKMKFNPLPTPVSSKSSPPEEAAAVSKVSDSAEPAKSNKSQVATTDTASPVITAAKGGQGMGVVLPGDVADGATGP